MSHQYTASESCCIFCSQSSQSHCPPMPPFMLFCTTNYKTGDLNMTQVWLENLAKGSRSDSKQYVQMLCNAPPCRITKLAGTSTYVLTVQRMKNILVPRITACFAFTVMSLLKHAISPPAFSFCDPFESCSEGASLSWLLPADGALTSLQLYR